MNMLPTVSAFTVQPFAIPDYDGHEDITDCWIEETDPQNERGEVCEAFFDDSVSGYGASSGLVGIRIFGGSGEWAINMPREMAIAILTPETVERLERIRAARIGDEY